MMKKILLILTFFLILKSSFSQIRYDDGGIRDNSTQIGEFVVQGNSWTNTRFITYFFQNTTNDIIPQANARAAVKRAFASWQAQTRLYFVEACNAAAADIVIVFGDGNHGDGFPFDGVNGVLAHAFSPPPNAGILAGDMHFDDGETWSELVQGSGFQPIDLQTVALHEIGHSLGLNHTPVTNSIMEAFYNGSRRNLGSDDIAGIRSIYGSPTEFINGNSFCGSSVFSINETLPAGYSIQWSALEPSITFVNNTANGSSTTVSNNGFVGNATIIATLTNGCSFLEFRKQVFIGPPGFGGSYNNGSSSGNPLAIYFPSQGSNNTFNNVCTEYGGYYIDATPYGSASTTWSIPSGLPYNGSLSWSQTTANRVNFYFTGGIAYLQGTVSNGCNSYSQIFAFKTTNCLPIGTDPCAKAISNYSIFTISPNPSSNQIKIGIVSKPAPPPPCLKTVPQNKTGIGYTFSIVNIYNKLGILEKSIKANNTNSIIIPTNTLKTGIYNVEIISGNYIEKKQIIIQK